MTTQCISFRDRTRDKEKKVVHKKILVRPVVKTWCTTGPRKKHLEFMVKKSITRVLTIWIPWTLNKKWSRWSKIIQNGPKLSKVSNAMVQNGLWISSPTISKKYFFVGHVLLETDQANAICYTFNVQNFLSFKVGMFVLVLKWNASYSTRIRKPLDIQIETILS